MKKEHESESRENIPRDQLAGPHIAPGAGSSFDDRKIAMIVGRWFDSINAADSKRLADVQAFIHGPKGMSPKGEAAQRSWFDQIINCYGDQLLEALFTAGQNVKFNGVIFFIKTETPAIPIDEDEQCRADGITRPKTWLSIYRATYSRAGRRSALNSVAHPIASLTRHASHRLVKRARVEKPSELLAVLTENCERLVWASVATADRRMERRGDSWAIPIRLPNVDGPVVLIMCGPTAGDFKNIFFAATAYGLDWVPAPMLDAFLALDAANLDEFADEGGEISAELFALYEAVRFVTPRINWREWDERH